MKFLTWQNPEQLFVAQELINKVKSKCCGIKVYCFMVVKVQLFFEIKREEFPKVEGKIPISDFGYLVHFSGMAVMIKRDCYLLLKPNMTE